MKHAVTFFVQKNEGEIFVPEEFCSPKCLVAMAIAKSALFVTCSKYGCKQFLNPLHPLNQR